MSASAARVDPAGLQRPWLLADIGGTNARFGWLAAGTEAIAHVQTLPVADHAGPAEAAQAYLRALQQTLGGDYQPPQAGAFAVATAVRGDQVAFTNSHWSFSRTATQQALQLQALLVLNDFEALALSLPRLQASQLRVWGGGVGGGYQAVDPTRGALAVVGPGTGLGVAGLVPVPASPGLAGAAAGPQRWLPVPGEGGHATLAPAGDFDSAVLAAARQLHGHVSAERLLSGIGLPTLHAAVATALGQRVPGQAELTTEQIVERGLRGTGPDGDAVCARTLDSFCALLGTFTGNVALTFGARGGVFIGGGIVPRLGDLFFMSRFRERFESKGRFQSYLQAIPTALITDTLVALTGAAVALEQHPA